MSEVAVEPLEMADPALSRVHDRNSRRILVAVRGYIDEHGIDNASMRQIAAVADVSLRTLYNLFGDRDGLVRALVHQSLDDVDIAMGELRADDPIERIWEAMDVAITTIVESLHVRVLTPILADDELQWQFSQRWHVREVIVDEIRLAQRSGQLYDDLSADVLIDQVGMALMHLLRGWAVGAVDDTQFRAGALHAVDLCLLAVVRPRRRGALRDHALALGPQLPNAYPTRPHTNQYRSVRS